MDAARRKRLGAYYTPCGFAEKAISLVRHEFEPTHIIEPSAGEGNLLFPAAERWKHVSASWMDIDPSCKLVSENYPGGCVGDFITSWQWFTATDRPLVISNPPFGKVKFVGDMRRTLVQSGFSEFIAFDRKTIPLELVFLSNIINLIGVEGAAMIVLPNTYLLGSSWRSLRVFLSKRFDIDIYSNYGDRFVGAEVETIAMYLYPKTSSNQIIKYETSKNERSKIIASRIDLSIFIDRWYRRQKVSSSSGVSVTRGNYTKSKFLQLGIKAIHSDMKIPHRHEGFIHETGVRTSKKGDILIPRVGRNLTNSILNNSGICFFTDCVFNISIEDKTKSKAIHSFLTSKEGKFEIENLKKGLCASYLTKSDVEYLCECALA